MSEPAQTDPPQPDADKPPWGDDFDAERAWSLVKNLRDDNAKLKSRPALTDEQQQKLTDWDRQEQASKTELERAREELTRWQTEASTWRTQAVSSRVERLAADAFADPSDALAAIPDPGKYLGAGGEIDEAAIKADLDALLARKPHWRRPAETGAPSTRVPAPNFAQGASGGGKTAADPASELAAILRSQLGT
jgi:hypothetical protein